MRKDRKPASSPPSEKCPELPVPVPGCFQAPIDCLTAHKGTSTQPTWASKQLPGCNPPTADRPPSFALQLAERHARAGQRAKSPTDLRPARPIRMLNNIRLYSVPRHAAADKCTHHRTQSHPSRQSQARSINQHLNFDTLTIQDGRQGSPRHTGLPQARLILGWAHRPQGTTSMGPFTLIRLREPSQANPSAVDTRVAQPWHGRHFRQGQRCHCDAHGQ